MIFLLACAVDTAAETAEAPTCETGEDAVWLVSSLTFSRETSDGVSAGFNFDGEVTASGDSTGCGLSDFTDPDGTPGIDNQFAVLLPVLEATEAQAVEGLIASAILDGSLLITLDLDHLDDRVDDTCVDFTFGRATGEPLIAADGNLEWYQTLQVDASLTESVAQGAVVDGTFRADGMEIVLPISILGNEFSFTIPEGSLRVTMQEDGTVTGYLGGGLSVADLVAVANTDNIDAALQELATQLIEANGDLDPDAEGVCQSLSVTFAFTAIPAFLVE